MITGRFTDKEARDLASALENPLRVPVEVEETRSVSPTLGNGLHPSGVLAGLTGLALVFGFVMVYYRFAGIVAFCRPAGEHDHPLRRDGDVSILC